MFCRHIILGLTGLVKLGSTESVLFGNEDSPQVIIKWLLGNWVGEHHGEFAPESDMLLLDSDLDVVLKPPPDDTIGVSIATEERHSLENYGADLLRRILNTKVSTLDADPVYLTMVKYYPGKCTLGLSKTSPLAPPSRRRERKSPRNLNGWSDKGFSGRHDKQRL